MLYTHIAQLMTYTTCIHSCCLPCNYVNKPFGILQRVIKSQRVYMYHLDSAKVDSFSLRKAKAAKFLEIFKFKFQCAIFKKEMFLLCPYEEMYSQFNCSDSNDILNKFSCLAYTWSQYLYINSKDRLNYI